MLIFQSNYWENRYQRGGTSGEGSIGQGRAWKWKIIESYVPDLQCVIDVGCGDLSFWSGRKCEDYTGIDISETILEKNKSSRPDWTFIRSSSDKLVEDLKRENVFCFDILFHIMDENVFQNTLHNLCQYSSKYLFIHTWKNNPLSRTGALRRVLKAPDLNTLKYIFLPAQTDTNYQYFRLLTNYLNIFQQHGFELLGEHENPNHEGCMYIFKKKEES
jgi:2-polyprenyl-3-methyl-5-hydroxy-6-metoxy-1,4-benzoquinol methylase